jgi:hypothetical protein
MIWRSRGLCLGHLLICVSKFQRDIWTEDKLSDSSRLTIATFQELLCEVRSKEAIHTGHQDPRSLRDRSFFLGHLLYL